MGRNRWGKMLDLVHGRWRGRVRRIAPREVARASSWHTVPRYDVTALAGEIDLDPLNAIQSAPVWMTRAERLLLYTLTFCLRPRRYLEIGTYQGGSALVVHSALTSLRSDARLFCVDPHPAIHAEHWQMLAKQTTLIEGHSPQILPEVMHLAGGRFDLILVDGDHSYRGVLADANGVLACAEHGGYILFHDGFHTQVGRAIDEFVSAQREQVIDLGMVTREVTSQVDDAGSRIEWGGLRLVYVT